ncbi:hypothetical protein TNCV_3303001 [Trichonephila clavipes]|nr:hypothetical protein TNCV_3303001 [Trichonephila clavipes]
MRLDVDREHICTYWNCASVHAGLGLIHNSLFINRVKIRCTNTIRDVQVQVADGSMEVACLLRWSPPAITSSSGASSYCSGGGGSTRATPSPPMMDSGQTDEGIDSDASSSFTADDSFPAPKRKRCDSYFCRSRRGSERVRVLNRSHLENEVSRFRDWA